MQPHSIERRVRSNRINEAGHAFGGERKRLRAQLALEEPGIDEDGELQGAAGPKAGANPLTLFPRTGLVFLSRLAMPARKV
jgi:hypothetical protein